MQLEKSVRADGSVEVWLMSLLKMAQQSLHAIIRQAHFVLQDPTINVLNFLDSFPAQVGRHGAVGMGFCLCCICGASHVARMDE